MMDILEDINAENKHLNAIAWFKKLCIVVCLITLCAGFFIYYKNVLDKKHATQDVTITNQLVRRYLSLNQAEQSQLPYERPASDVLKLVEINSLIKKNEKTTAQKELSSLMNAQSDAVNSVARITWMSLALDMDDKNLDREQFQTCLSYFAKNTATLFWGRAHVLGAIFFLKTNQASKAKALLTKVMYSTHCTNAIKDEAKAVLLLITHEQNKG